MKVVLLTGNELRHEFFRKFIAHDDGINVLATFCESEKGNLNELINKEAENPFRQKHLASRKLTEEDFFKIYCDHITDKSSPIFIEKGQINDAIQVNTISNLNPDVIISYGCSIIRSSLLTAFKDRFMNIHLGLSPYYRGSGTNFWPFVNKELQFVGTTFMYIDSGVDTGEIIHQIRARIDYNDNIHQIGNRLIKDSFVECKKLIKQFFRIKKMEQPNPDKMKDKKRYYRKIDFTEDAVKNAYRNIEEGMIENYLSNKELIDRQFPILTNPIFL